MNNSSSETSNKKDPKETPESIPTLNIGEWGILAGLSAEDLKSVNNVAEVWARIALAVAEDRGLFK